MDIQIFKMSLNDLNSVYNIEESLDNKILSPESLKKDLENPNYYYIVAKYDDLLVAYAGIEFMVDHVDLISIAVKKDFRNLKIATNLLNHLAIKSLEKNIFEMFLEVRTNNVAAINFYEKRGFKKINIRKNYYNNDSAFIYYKKLA